MNSYCNGLYERKKGRLFRTVGLYRFRTSLDSFLIICTSFLRLEALCCLPIVCLTNYKQLCKRCRSTLLEVLVKRIGETNIFVTRWYKDLFGFILGKQWANFFGGPYFCRTFLWSVKAYCRCVKGLPFSTFLWKVYERRNCSFTFLSPSLPSPFPPPPFGTHAYFT